MVHNQDLIRLIGYRRLAAAQDAQLGVFVCLSEDGLG